MSGQKPSAKVQTTAEQVLSSASLTFRERFMRAGIIGAGGRLCLILVLFLGGLYASYRYFLVKKFEKDYKTIIQDK